MREQPKIICTNKPNMNYIMQVLCELLSRQDGGKYEYTYTLTKKEEYSENELEAKG